MTYVTGLTQAHVAYIRCGAACLPADRDCTGGCAAAAAAGTPPKELFAILAERSGKTGQVDINEVRRGLREFTGGRNWREGFRICSLRAAPGGLARSAPACVVIAEHACYQATAASVGVDQSVCTWLQQPVQGLVHAH